MMRNIDDITEKVCEIAIDAGDFILAELPKIQTSDIFDKDVNSFVTYVDKTAEQRIISSLIRMMPDAGFIVEENSIRKEGNEYKWIVDPLDGTTNYIHGIPCFSVSIALMKGDQLISGVVYEINKNECFYAWRGGGAWLNGHPIKVSSAASLQNSLLATGFPYYDYSRLDDYMKLFIWCLQNTRGVRRIGSAAVDLAYVACGRFEGFFEYSLSPWDVAAGSLIVQEAGGKVSDFAGKDNYLFGKEIIASNMGVYKELMKQLNQCFDHNNSS